MAAHTIERQAFSRCSGVGAFARAVSTIWVSSSSGNRVSTLRNSSSATSFGEESLRRRAVRFSSRGLSDSRMRGLFRKKRVPRREGLTVSSGSFGALAKADRKAVSTSFSEILRLSVRATEPPSSRGLAPHVAMMKDRASCSAWSGRSSALANRSSAGRFLASASWPLRW